MLPHRCTLLTAILVTTPATLLAQQATFAGRRAGQEWNKNGLQMKFCWCPAGRFTMGSPKDEKDRGDDEDQVQVVLSQGFWLGKYEVMQGQWRSLMESQPWLDQFRAKTGADYPANYVSWDDAAKFCTAFTRQEQVAGRLPAGWEYRLPTEAQWEYACRAGTQTRYSFGDAETQLVEYAWYDKNADAIGEKYAHRCGLKKSNNWGSHDMHGNLWEWTRDWYHGELPGGRDPEAKRLTKTRTAKWRVYRGGDWRQHAQFCRSAYRSGSLPDDRQHYIGFRVVIVQVPPRS